MSSQPSAPLLIAGCGDLGQRVAALWQADAGTAHGLRRTPPVATPGTLRWHAADLTRPHTLTGLPEQFGAVLFCPTPGARSAQAYRSVFVDGLRHLLALPSVQAAPRLVFVSSTAVYGEHHGQWVDEDTPTGPLGENGRILLEGEALAQTGHAGAVVLRLAGLYGPGRLSLIERLRQGQARAPRTPPHWANRMHIDDAAAACRHLLGLAQPAPVYLGADDTPLPLDVLYTHLAGLAGAPAVPPGPAPANVGSKRICNARLKASGLRLRWPDSRAGYAALLQAD